MKLKLIGTTPLSIVQRAASLSPPPVSDLVALPIERVISAPVEGNSVKPVTRSLASRAGLQPRPRASSARCYVAGPTNVRSVR